MKQWLWRGQWTLLTGLLLASACKERPQVSVVFDEPNPQGDMARLDQYAGKFRLGKELEFSKSHALPGLVDLFDFSVLSQTEQRELFSDQLVVDYLSEKNLSNFSSLPASLQEQLTEGIDRDLLAQVRGLLGLTSGTQPEPAAPSVQLTRDPGKPGAELLDSRGQPLSRPLVLLGTDGKAFRSGEPLAVTEAFLIPENPKALLGPEGGFSETALDQYMQNRRLPVGNSPQGRFLGPDTYAPVENVGGGIVLSTKPNGAKDQVIQTILQRWRLFSLEVQRSVMNPNRLDRVERARVLWLRPDLILPRADLSPELKSFFEQHVYKRDGDTLEFIDRFDRPVTDPRKYLAELARITILTPLYQQLQSPNLPHLDRRQNELGYYFADRGSYHLHVSTTDSRNITDFVTLFNVLLLSRLRSSGIREHEDSRHKWTSDLSQDGFVRLLSSVWFEIRFHTQSPSAELEEILGLLSMPEDRALLTMADEINKNYEEVSRYLVSTNRRADLWHIEVFFKKHLSGHALALRNDFVRIKNEAERGTLTGKDLVAVVRSSAPAECLDLLSPGVLIRWLEAAIDASHYPQMGALVSALVRRDRYLSDEVVASLVKKEGARQLLIASLEKMSKACQHRILARLDARFLTRAERITIRYLYRVTSKVNREVILALLSEFPSELFSILDKNEIPAPSLGYLARRAAENPDFKAELEAKAQQGTPLGQDQVRRILSPGGQRQPATVCGSIKSR